MSAEREAHPLGKSTASVSLLAYLIIAKYCDGLPLYSLEGILKRYVRNSAENKNVSSH